MKKIDSFNISAQHPSLAGHFPGNPIVPGVVLLEQLERIVQQHVEGWKIVELMQVKFLMPTLPEEWVEVSLDLSRLCSHKTLTFILSNPVSGSQNVTGKIKCEARLDG